MFAGFRVGAVKENPLWVEAEKVRKAKGKALAFAAWRIAPFSPGTLEIAAFTVHWRNSGAAEAAALTMTTTASGLPAMAALMMRSTRAQSEPGFAFEFLTAALIATA